MNKNWIYLSHLLNDKLFAYGNGVRIVIEKSRNIEKGDSTNNSVISLPTHFGTHIDFPFHFDNMGKKGEDYPADFFVFQNVLLINLNVNNILDYKITKEDFKKFKFNSNIELLIIETGMYKYRAQPEYWNSNPCFTPQLAKYFKDKMPKLRAIGFDSMSLTGWKYRDIGKIAHKEFLIKNNILIIEDMKLNEIKVSNNIKKVVVSPLRYDNADGSPVTVLCKIEK